MPIAGVVWLHAIVDKLAVRHHVATHEVEEVLTNDEDLLSQLSDIAKSNYVAVEDLIETWLTEIVAGASR